MNSVVKDCFSKKLKEEKLKFMNVDWADSKEDRRSTIEYEYCTFVWRNLVTWRSKKQIIVAKNSTEIEFQAVAKITNQNRNSAQILLC